MANDKLKLYLVERLIDLDPTLNDSEGSLMYIKVIDPLLKRLGTDPLRVDIETFLISRLQDEYPKLDIKSPGSVIRDLLVNPLALLLEPLQREVEFLRIQNSLADADSLTEGEMDALLSNVLSERQSGDYARGIVRVYFNTARSVGMDSSIVFSTVDGTSFVPTEPFTYSPDQMTRSGGKYYLDIPAKSQIPSTGSNIGSGQIRYVNGLDGVSRVTNLAAFTGGVTQETNEDFLVRAERSLTERSLNTKRGIETEILNSFDDIVSIEVVGSGEADMKRDIVQAQAKQEFDESIGPLIYMTGNWRTHGLIANTLQDSAIACLPFTNVVKIMPPAGGAGTNDDGGWPEDLKDALLDAKYIRVADGSGLTWSHNDVGSAHKPGWGDSDGTAAQGGTDSFRDNTYKDPLLNRIRAVESTYFHNTGSAKDHAIYMKLRDFDVYPQPATITDTIDPAKIADLNTSSVEMGLNRRSAQGTAFKMIGDKDSSDIILGAYLPFTDYIGTSFTAADVPTSVIPGRDFLASYTQGGQPGILIERVGDIKLGIAYPGQFRMWPMNQFYSSTELGVGRIDSFLVSKSRTAFSGKSEYVYNPDLQNSMIRERINIIDYGSPFFTETADQDKRFGGQEKEDSGRNPGCAIEVMKPLPSLLPELSSSVAHPAEVDLVLHNSQDPWSSRGVVEGQYVACCVFADDISNGVSVFDGKLTTAKPELEWQGWGRVVKVGSGTPWRLRVEGMDFGPMHENNLGGFSPRSRGKVTLTGVPQIPPGGHPPGQMVRVEIYESGTTSLSIAYLGVDTQWDSAGTIASKDFSISESSLTAEVGGANAGKFEGGELEFLSTILSATNTTLSDATSYHSTFQLWVTGLVNLLNANTTNHHVSMSAVVSGSAPNQTAVFTVTTDLYGGYGNTIYMNAGTSNNKFCVQNSIGIGSDGYLAGGVAPTLANLANEIISVINNHSSFSPYVTAYAEGPSSDGVVVISSIFPGDAGNPDSIDHPYRINHADASIADFGHTTWDQYTKATSTGANHTTGSGILHGGTDYMFSRLSQHGLTTSLTLSASPPFTSGGYIAPKMNLASGDLTEYGQEVPEVAPVLDGLTSSYDLILDEKFIRPGTARLHYWDVKSSPTTTGQWVYWDDDGLGGLTQIYPAPGVGTTWLTSSVVDYDEGKITLVFDAAYTPHAYNLAIPLPARQYAAFSIGYNYLTSDRYRACWTVYQGIRETVSADGDLGISYDDFAYAPAYKRPGPYGLSQGTENGTVVARGASSYIGDRWKSEANGELGTSYCYDKTSNEPNPRKGLWIRLGKGFDKSHPSIGGTPAEKCLSSEVIDMETAGEGVAGETWTSLPAGFSETFSQVEQLAYSKKRYGITGDDNFDAVGDKEFVATRASLPAVSGAVKLNNPSLANTAPTGMSFDLDEMSFVNSKGMQGFLLPHPMGPAHYGTTEFPYANNNIASGHLLDHQILQVYESSVSDASEDTGIVISGMPGGTPFPGIFGGDFEIDDNKVHIGGMTDVYVKATSVEEEATGSIKLRPEKLDAVEVLVEGIDGVINSFTNPTHFESVALRTAISTSDHYSAQVNSIGSDIYLDNLVIEILDPQSPELQPLFFRVIHTASTTGVVIDGEFPEGVSYTGIRFRALFGCTTSVSNPLVVLQQGNDLVIKKGDKSVLFSSGINFGTSPSNVSMFISIDSRESKGEYEVTGKSGDSLSISSAIPESGSNLEYRVYTKQITGVNLPLVRLKTVSLSGGETEGIRVPYKNPVDIIASSFVGMNDDPINEESIGEDPNSSILWKPTLRNISGKAHLIVHDNEDFVVEHNIVKYDVVRIDSLDAPNRNFYVEGFTYVDTGSASATNKNNALILDRAVEGTLLDIVEVKFSLGRAAVGTAELVFKDPTFIEIGTDTVFSYERSVGTVGRSTLGDQSTVKFRPSPLESAVLYKTSYQGTDLRIDANAPGVIVSDDENFQKHGLMVGDLLTILTRVISSSYFDGASAQLEDKNLMLAGKTLAIDVEGVRKSVVFSGPNPVTLEQAVSDINRQMGDDLKVGIEEGSTDQYRLTVSSNKPIQLVDEGSVGILDELKFTGLDQQDNNYYVVSNPGPNTSELFDPYVVTKIAHTNVGPANTWSITIESVSGGYVPAITAGTVESIFVEARRRKYQRIYPGDMVQNDLGFHTAKVTLTSYDPNTTEALITDKTQLDITDHKSFGYEMVVENTDYSYSLGEECSIKTTGVILGSTDTSLEKVYALPGADVTITYERSQSVADVQGLLFGKDLRVVCNNPLSKHFFPAYPYADISYGDSGYSASEIKVLLEEYFKTLYPNKPLEIYDVTSILSRRGVGYVKFPQTLAFLVHDENRVMKIVRDENIIYLNKRFHIMEDTSGITINKVR